MQEWLGMKITSDFLESREVEIFKIFKTTITKLACFVGVPGAASPPDNFHHHTDMICEWAGSKNAIMTYGLDAHKEAYQTTGIKPGQKDF